MYKYARGATWAPKFAYEPETASGKTAEGNKDHRPNRSSPSGKPTKYWKKRRLEEELLIRIAEHLICSAPLPTVPRILRSKLTPIFNAQGGMISWAKSHPSFPSAEGRARIKGRVQSKVRKKTSATKRKLDSRLHKKRKKANAPAPSK